MLLQLSAECCRTVPSCHFAIVASLLEMHVVFCTLLAFLICEFYVGWAHLGGSGDKTLSYVCKNRIPEEQIYSRFVIQCPPEQYINRIVFGSFGTPIGSCDSPDDPLRSVNCHSIFPLDMAGDPTSSESLYPSTPLNQEQVKTDQNVLLAIDNVCYGKNYCDWKDELGSVGIASPTAIFGDPCPGVRKFLSLNISCGTITHDNKPFPDIKWSYSQKFNKANFQMTKKALDMMYAVVLSPNPYDTLLDRFKDAQMLFLDNAAAGNSTKARAPPQRPFDPPMRFTPLITWEDKFGSKYLGLTTAWFGVIARLPLEDTLIIIFRGTQSATDWIYDFTVFSEKIPNVMMDEGILPSGNGTILDHALVHSGFVRLYLGMRNTLFRSLEKLQFKNIILCGHSLGAALGTLAVFDLANHGYKIHSSYLFASPRVGNPFFVRACHQALEKSSGVSPVPLYRISNLADIVNAIPPAALTLPKMTFTKYMHVGSTRYTFEAIPLDPKIEHFHAVEFFGWAHSLDTYIEVGTPVLPFDDDSSDPEEKTTNAFTS